MLVSFPEAGRVATSIGVSSLGVLHSLLRLPKSAALLALLCALVSPPPLDAQAVAEWFVCDSTDDRVMHLIDTDGDGLLTSAEAFVFYDDTSDGPDLSTPSHIVPWNAGYLVSDGGTLDAIYFLADLNGDGDANDSGEIRPFYDDSAPGLDLSSPTGLAVRDDGALFVCDDGATVRAILRIVDLDGNGDALGPDELTVYFDQTASLSEPVTDPESVAVAPDGTIVIGDSATGRVIRLNDLDGDGTALGVGEATVVYDATGPIVLNDIDAIQVDGAGRIYAIDEDTGTVLRLTDLNGDGDALDSGEVILFHDNLAPGSVVTDPNDAILIGPGQLVVVDGAIDAIVLLSDLDGDGAALAPDETTILFEDAGVTFSTPHGITPAGESGPPPVGVFVTSVTPTVGDATGGTVVTLLGSGWSNGPVVVDFGGSSVSATVVSSSELSVVAPTHAPALVDVSVSAGGMTAIVPGAFRFQNRFLRGDVTHDGVVGLADPIVLLSHLFIAGAAVPPCLDAADANDNDSLDLEDAIGILDYLFGGGSPPAAPFSSVGFDPTPLGPGCATALTP